MPPRRPAEPGIPARWDQVLAWRLDRHHLTEPAPPAPGGGDRLVELVRRLSGLHAQLASAAEAAAWLRTAGAVGPADVRAALAEHRTLVKTWTVRGTLHLLPAADLPRWAAALGTRSFPRPESWYRYHGVTPEDMAAIEQTVPAVLGGTPVTREELAGQVAKRSRRPQLAELLLSGWGAVLKPLAARGELAFGPVEGRNVTFVDPRKWLGSWPRPPDPEQAVASVVRDFLATYGPAGLDELTRWSALDKPVLRRAVGALGDELVELDTEGHRGWVTRAAAEQIAHRAEPGGAAAGRLRPVRGGHAGPAEAPAAGGGAGRGVAGQRVDLAGAGGRRPHRRHLDPGGPLRPAAGRGHPVRPAARRRPEGDRGRGRAVGRLRRRPARPQLEHALSRLTA